MIEPNEVRKNILRISKGESPPGCHHGVITGALNKACGDDKGRYKVLYYLFRSRHEEWKGLDKVSSKDLTPGEWHALYRWSHPDRAEDFIKECEAILAKLAEKKDWGGSVAEYLGLVNDAEFEDHAEMSDEELIQHYIETRGTGYLMRCGHRSDSYTAFGAPCCKACAGKGRYDAFILATAVKD